MQSAIISGRGREVVVMAAILEDEDVDLLEVDVDLMEANNASEKGPR